MVLKVCHFLSSHFNCFMQQSLANALKTLDEMLDDMALSGSQVGKKTSVSDLDSSVRHWACQVDGRISIWPRSRERRRYPSTDAEDLEVK